MVMTHIFVAVIIDLALSENVGEGEHSFFIVWSKVQLRQGQQHNTPKFVMSHFGCLWVILVHLVQVKRTYVSYNLNKVGDKWEKILGFDMGVWSHAEEKRWVYHT